MWLHEGAFEALCPKASKDGWPVTFSCPRETGQRAVAQLGSALDWGSRGRRFKSCQPDHENPLDTGIQGTSRHERQRSETPISHPVSHTGEPAGPQTPCNFTAVVCFA